MNFSRDFFIDDVKDHRIKIVNDDGLNRHLYFGAKNSINHWFELITAKGMLIINGDMGSYAFRRLDDMFNFFRRPDGSIDASYWHEKMVADSTYEPAKKFSHDALMAYARDAFVDGCKDDLIPIDSRRTFWKTIKKEILNAENEYDAHEKLHRFEYKFGYDCDTFTFYDTWEWDLTEFSYHFLWCLHAIVWGINQYDKEKLSDGRH